MDALIWAVNDAKVSFVHINQWGGVVDSEIEFLEKGPKSRDLDFV